MQNFELFKDFTSVNHQIHQRAFQNHLPPTKVRCIDESVESQNSIGSLFDYHSNSVFDLLRFHQFGNTALPGTLVEYVWYAEREKFWNGVLLVADLEQVDVMEESEFRAEKLNAKEVILHKMVTFYFPNRSCSSENLLEEIRF